ncbi:MAG: DUF6128 domain-containing protein [Butyrivibrio sp.]|nr:DUF6128 domain-containing protein [Butyrivibrio sp.]
MEYNRMIAYIYSYNDGLKSRNTGFAKLEVRQGVLKLQVNMKGAYSDGSEPWSVKLFYREGGRIRGVLLGEIKIKNGTGEYRYAGSAENIAGSGIGFGSVKGLYISCDGNMHKMYASEWDDLGFSPSSIAAGGEGAARSSAIVEFAVPEPIKQPDKPSLFAEPESAHTEAAVGYEPESKAAESVVLAAAEVEAATREERDGAARQTSSGAEIFDGIIDGREKIFLFADDDLYDTVEINTDDLNRFPEASLGLANNSFVNHGYYNFRHLILGRIRESGGCGYFIGVPGVYTRRDRSTASMFGFNYFKFSMRSDVRLGQFGYWYRELEC